LEDETRQHDVPAEIGLRFCVCEGSHGAADGLENQADEIASTEDDCVRARLEVREVGSVDRHDAGEAEVDGCGEQGRCYGQGDEGDEEIVVVEGSVVEQDSTDVSRDFERLPSWLGGEC